MFLGFDHYTQASESVVRSIDKWHCKIFNMKQTNALVYKSIAGKFVTNSCRNRSEIEMFLTFRLFVIYSIKWQFDSDGAEIPVQELAKP